MNKDLLLRILFFFIFNTSLYVYSAPIYGTISGGINICDTINSGFLAVNPGSYNCVSYDWEISTDFGITWSPTGTSAPTHSVTGIAVNTQQSYTNLKSTCWYRIKSLDSIGNYGYSNIQKMIINPNPNGGIINGVNNFDTTFCSNSGTDTLKLTDYAVNVLYWLTSTDNELTWDSIPNTNPFFPYSNLTSSKSFRAVAGSVGACPLDTSSVARLRIDSFTVAGSFTNTNSVACSSGSPGQINLSGYTGNILFWESSLDNGLSYDSIANISDSLIYSNLSSSIWYRTIVKSGICNADTTSVLKLSVVTPVQVDAGPNETINQYETITLQASGNGSIVWSPSISLDDSTIFNPISKPPFTTMYTATLTDSNSCVTTDSVEITVIIPIPNVITPNGDGANDFFIIDEAPRLPENSINIYNRSGSLVFAKSPYDNSFNGTNASGSDLPDGIYYYTLDFGDERDPITNFILIKR